MSHLYPGYQNTPNNSESSPRNIEEFEQVKSIFRQETLNRYFDPKKDTYIFVDAHRSGLGAVLSQGNSIKNTVPIAIAGRTTTKV